MVFKRARVLTICHSITQERNAGRVTQILVAHFGCDFSVLSGFIELHSFLANRVREYSVLFLTKSCQPLKLSGHFRTYTGSLLERVL
jgi:hypothetical protein